MACLAALPSETPPRAWGRPSHPGHGNPLAGNTPTGVGKTLFLLGGLGGLGKHPHGRGEDAPLSFGGSSDKETPPRAWGRLAASLNAKLLPGNTPTGVGKTMEIKDRRFDEEKHPHGRGEDRRSLMSSAPTAETPPRAWGRR